MHDPLVVAFTIRRPWPKRFHGILEGRCYWPSMVTVWHREPRGHDSGEVCKHYRKRGGRPPKYLNGWRFHVWHWRIQVEPLQHLRRWALTRCAWCGGRSRKGDYVNISHQWRDSSGAHWWQGEPGLFHGDCSSVERAHSLCYCKVPVLSMGGHGRCEVCGGFRAWRQEPGGAARLLASLPEGSRITDDIRPQIEALWEQRKAREASA